MNILIFPIQLVAIVFMVFAFSRVWLRAREGSIGRGMFLFWILVWLLLLVAVVRPELSTQLAKKLGIGRGLTSLYISLSSLYFI